MSSNPVSKRAGRGEWTLTRVAALSIVEIKQLRDNAQRLNEPGLVELCSQALRGSRRPGPARVARPRRAPDVSGSS